MAAAEPDWGQVQRHGYAIPVASKTVHADLVALLPDEQSPETWAILDASHVRQAAFRGLEPTMDALAATIDSIRDVITAATPIPLDPSVRVAQVDSLAPSGLVRACRSAISRQPARVTSVARLRDGEFTVTLAPLPGIHERTTLTRFDHLCEFPREPVATCRIHGKPMLRVDTVHHGSVLRVTNLPHVEGCADAWRACTVQVSVRGRVSALRYGPVGALRWDKAGTA